MGHALGKPDLREHGPGLLARRIGRDAPDAQRHRDVVEGTEFGQQVVELVDEAEMPIAPPPLLRRAHRGEVAPHQIDAAGARRFEPAEQVQQRALARTRRADDGHPVDLTVDGAPGRFVAFADGLDVERLPADCMVTGTPETRMRAAIVVRQTTRRPMVLLGPAGELVGVVGEHELYRGMLKQTDLALAPAAAAAP